MCWGLMDWSWAAIPLEYSASSLVGSYPTDANLIQVARTWQGFFPRCRYSSTKANGHVLMADLIATPRALRPTKFPLRKVQLVRKPQPIDPHSIYLSLVVLERTQFYIAYYLNYIAPCTALWNWIIIPTGLGMWVSYKRWVVGFQILICMWCCVITFLHSVGSPLKINWAILEPYSFQSFLSQSLCCDIDFAFLWIFVIFICSNMILLLLFLFFFLWGQYKLSTV